MTDVDTSSPTTPAAIDAVPLRHPWRWVAAVTIVILVLLFLYGAATNKAFGWDTYAKYLFDRRVTQTTFDVPGASPELASERNDSRSSSEAR